MSKVFLIKIFFRVVRKRIRVMVREKVEILIVEDIWVMIKK